MNYSYVIGNQYEKMDEEITVKYFTSQQWQCTPTKLVEHYDFTVEKGNLKYLIESKIRYETTDKYNTLYLNEDKVKYLKEISTEKNIPFVVFYAFPKNNIVYLITEKDIDKSPIKTINVKNPAKGQRIEYNYIIDKSTLQRRKLNN